MKNERTGTVAGHGLRAAARTDCGRQRVENEDRYLLDLERGIFLVIDGVGGQAAGEVAARIAHDTIRKRLERRDAADDVRVREAITLANQQILLHAQDSPARKGMACVLTLAVLDGRRVTVGHVGDTRLYRFSPEGLAKMTHDHSPVGEREDAREISETEAMQHARRNEVYRDVGSEPRQPDAADFIEIVATSIDDDTALLMCSDGLSDMLPSLEINRLVRDSAGDPARVADALVDAANQAGGKDNITVLYVEGRRFAKSTGPARLMPMPRPAAQQVATEALDGFDGVDGSPDTPSTRPPAAGHVKEPARGGKIGKRAVALMFILGVLVGFGTALGLAYMQMPMPWPWPARADAGPREFTVGPSAPFATIGEALLQAQDGDVIRVQPGLYPEPLELRRGVTLISEVPRGAVLTAPVGRPAWASVTVWSNGTAMRGFRISRDGGAGHVGVRVHAGEIDIEDVGFDGALQVGVDAVGQGSRAHVRASRFEALSGVPVQVGEGASVSLRENLFRAAAGATGPAVACAVAEGVSLHGNLFVHFAGAPVVAATGTAIVVAPSDVVPPPAAPRGGRR